MARMNFNPGKRVKVSEGSGIDSRKVGTIIPRSRVRTRGDGVPMLPGHYKPLRADEVIIEVDGTKEIISMFKSHLSQVD